MSKLSKIGFALRYLRMARAALIDAGAPEAANAVRRAISSAKGAHRRAALESHKRERQCAKVDP